MKNIWQILEKPIFILAPMEDVTDTVFRQIVMSCGRPDLFFTEFTNVDGIFSSGKENVIKRLQFSPEEKPVIAQIWGMKPENFYKAATLIVEMGFDGIDINMGCPEKSVTSKGACSALINNQTLAKEIIQATIEGSAKQIPVSVKTRIGFKSIQTEEWIGFLLDQNIDALTVHARTSAEMSAVPAHWEELEMVVKLRNEKNKDTIIVGNGDVASLQEAKEKIALYHIDGVMIGRGIFHNPWLFDETVIPEQVSVVERLELLTRHVQLFEKTWGNNKNFPILKKYFKIYLSGFPGAQDLRIQFMATKNYEEVYQKVKEIKNSL